MSDIFPYCEAMFQFHLPTVIRGGGQPYFKPRSEDSMIGYTSTAD